MRGKPGFRAVRSGGGVESFCCRIVGQRLVQKLVLFSLQPATSLMPTPLTWVSDSAFRHACQSLAFLAGLKLIHDASDITQKHEPLLFSCVSLRCIQDKQKVEPRFGKVLQGSAGAAVRRQLHPLSFGQVRRIRMQTLTNLSRRCQYGANLASGTQALGNFSRSEVTSR